MARKRTYRDPKMVVCGVSVHRELAEMTEALAKKSNRPKSYIVELALATYMENRRLLNEVMAA